LGGGGGYYSKRGAAALIHKTEAFPKLLKKSEPKKVERRERGWPKKIGDE